ncbi:MFS transporter [Chloroflexota bacterium]
MLRTEGTASKYRWVILGVLWIAYIVVFLHRLSIGPLAPFLKEDLGISSAQVGALMSAAAFGYMFSCIPAGWATDKFGVRWLLVIGEFVGGVFIMMMMFVSSYIGALIIMAFAGFGCGCLMPGTTKGVLVWFPQKERATVMGIKQTAVNVGGIITALTLPSLAIALGWRFGFLFLGLVAIAIGTISFIFYKDPPVSAASSLESTGETRGPSTVQLLRELFKSRDIWLVYVYLFTLIIVEFALIAHLVLYLTEALFFPILAAGGILAMTEAAGVLGKPAGGIISDRLLGGSRRKVLLLWGGIASVMCFLLTVFGSDLSWGLYPILLALGVTVIGFGGVQLTLTAELAGKELAGIAAGMNGVAASLGIIVGPIVFGHIVDVTGSYQLAWFSCTVFAVISVLAVLFVREERKKI